MDDLEINLAIRKIFIKDCSLVHFLEFCMSCTNKLLHWNNKIFTLNKYCENFEKIFISDCNYVFFRHKRSLIDFIELIKAT